MSGFKEIEVGTEGLNYIKDRLAEGNSLSQALLNSRDLASGKVTTYLPAAISDREAKQFSTGGKLRIPRRLSVTLAIRGSNWRIEPKPNLDTYIVKMIRSFLGQRGSCCIFEDAKSRPTDPWIQSEDGRIKNLDDEVYYVLDEKDANDEEKIARTVRDAQSGWHFVGVMSLPPRNGRLSGGGRNLSADDLRALAERAVVILVGAYDGEGYLVWSKNPKRGKRR
jgi:hypothetical protein